MTKPDPYSPEWTVYWTLTKALRTLIKPRDEQKPAIIADQVVKDLRLHNWHLIRGMPRGAHGGGPGANQIIEKQHKAFANKLRELEEMSDASPADWRQGKLDV